MPTIRPISDLRYDRDQARLELDRLLDEAEADVRSGDRGVSPAVMRKRLGVTAPSHGRPAATPRLRAASLTGNWVLPERRPAK